MKISHIIFAMGLWLASIGQSFAGQPVRIVTTEIPPYTSNEINSSGFLTEIVTSAFIAGGRDPKVRSLTWASGKFFILTGKADVIFPGSFEEIEELNAVGVLLYKTTPLVFVKQKNRSVPWNGYVNSLKDLRIGVVKRFSYTEEFNNASNFHKKRGRSDERNIKALMANRIDLAIMDELTARYYIKKLDLEDQLTIASPPLINSTEFYLNFSQSLGLRKAQQDAFRKGLSAIQADGTYEKILEKYKVNRNIQLRKQAVEIVKLTDEGVVTVKPAGSGVLSKVKKTDPKNMIVGFCGFHWNTDGYQKTYKKVLVGAAERYGVRLVLHDAKASIDTQVQQVEALIAQQVDVIAVWPVHGKAILPVLEKARQAGIPVLIVNTPVDVSGFNLIRAYTGPNNVQEGKLAAQMMIEALKGKGTVAEIQGFPGYSTAIERSVGFYEELEKQKSLHPEIDIEIIDVIAGYWSRDKAEQAARRLMRRHAHFDGLYVADDNMGIGAMKALEEAGRLDGVTITSATLFGDGYDAIKSGKIYGSVWQNPAEDAELALKIAIKIIRQEDIEFFNFFNTPKVTRENINQLERPPF